MQPTATLAILLATVLLLPDLQGQGTLRLPPPKKQQEGQQPAPADADAEVERFRRDLMELRSVARQRGPAAEAILRRMSEEYRDLGPLIVQLARTARAREMEDLMLVARRFGTAKLADELLFQLLVRPLGTATREVMDTVAFLKGPDAKRTLMDCCRSRIAGVRRAATEQLAKRVGVEDLEFALGLTSERSLDLQLSGVKLLAAIDDDRSRRRLVQILSKDPTVASAACRALIEQGVASVAVLQEVLRQPAMDRSFGYAAFALAVLEDRAGREFLSEETVPALRRELDSNDTTERALVAVALANLAWRSTQASPETNRDAEIVEALLPVVAPTEFVTNLNLLKGPATERLVRLTGHPEPASPIAWRDWWESAREGFVGTRARVRVSPENAAATLVVLEAPDRTLRLIGEGLADLPVREGALEVLLTDEEMVAVVQELESAGFMQRQPEAGNPNPLPRTRTLQLQVHGARTLRTAPENEAPAFDRMVAVLDECLERERWQLYRHPEDEPDRGAFWRAERRWLEAHPDPVERSRRLVNHVLKAWPVLDEGRRDLAVRHLFAVADKEQVVGEAEGLRMVELALSADEIGPHQVRLLELALVAPGETVWRKVLDLACSYGEGAVARREAIMRVFSLLGPERVIASLSDERRVVRLVAIDEVVKMRDLRAGPRLLAMLDDPEIDVRRAAVYALGQLPVRDARVPLMKLVAREGVSPVIRRESLAALGRIGGDGVFEMLSQALSAPGVEDRMAAVKGLGEMRDSRAAELLAEVFAAQHGNTLGELARFYLQKQGAILARPALRAQLEVANTATRQAVVLLLGSFQDPVVVPELVDLLDQGVEPLRVSEILEGTTGLDLGEVDDRVAAVDGWYRVHRQEPQSQWLLQALEREGVQTTLTTAQFDPAAGLAAVPELSRLLVDAPSPHLRMLVAAVLRDVTREDFGIVTPYTSRAALEAMAVRYRYLVDAAKAASKR